MLEWIKQFRTIHWFVALVVGTVFNVGVMSATMPKAKEFSIEREARADLDKRVSVIEDHTRQDDLERAELRARLAEVERLLIGIAIQVGAPVPQKVGK